MNQFKNLDFQINKNFKEGEILQKNWKMRNSGTYFKYYLKHEPIREGNPLALTEKSGAAWQRPGPYSMQVAATILVYNALHRDLPARCTPYLP